MKSASASGRPDVSIGVVVVNWRNASDTVSCLESLRAASPRPDRVVLIDNGSGDGSVDRFRKWAQASDISHEVVDVEEQVRSAAPDLTTSPLGTQWLTIIGLTENLGFAGGNNVGLGRLENEGTLTHFLLLNNDAIVERDYFSAMRSVLEAHPDAGLCIGTIYELPNRSRVWYAGGRIIACRALAAHSVAVPPNDEPTPTEFVTGCAMVIARPVLERIGNLPECYFPGYMEDAEYSWRARAGGFELLYAPRPVVYHKVGASFGARATSPLTAFHQNRHRVYFVRRNLRGVSRILALAYMIMTKPARALLDLVQGRRAIGWATLRGTWSGLTTAPRDEGRSLAERLPISSARDRATR